MRATLVAPCTIGQLKEWTDKGIPVMIGWNPEGRPWSHASVVFDVDDDLNIHVADPNIPNPKETVRIVPEEEFYSKWSEDRGDYLVRRPAMAIEREITPDRRQVMASVKSSKEQKMKFTVEEMEARLRQARLAEFDEDEIIEEDLGDFEEDEITDKEGRNPGGVSIPMEEMVKRYGPEWKTNRDKHKDKFTKKRKGALYELWSEGHRNQEGYPVGSDEDHINKLAGLGRLVDPANEDGPVALYQSANQFTVVANLNGPWAVDLSHAQIRMAAQGIQAARIPGGLYGYTKAVQKDCETAVKRLNKVALAMAKKAFQKDERIVPFLTTHSKRSKSTTAKILLASLKTIGPREASEIKGGKTAAGRRYSLYGYPEKTVRSGLSLCSELRHEAGRIAVDLHMRKAALHGKITGFFSTHGKKARCNSSRILLAGYPDADLKFASEPKVASPETVDGWLLCEEAPF
jgi:hypothetical protein